MIPRATSQFEHKNEQVPEKSDMSVWQETIEGTNGPLYLIRGQWLAGSVQANVGDTVYVEWKDGLPYRIIDYEVRRGIAHTIGGGAVKGIVEQLFLAPSTATGGKTTVWFRNHNQVTELRYDNEDGTRLYTDWANPAVDVFWGVNVDHFAVLEKGATGTEQFHVYRIKRQANLNKILASKAKVVEKVYSKKLSDVPAIDLVTIKVDWLRDSVEPYARLNWSAPASGVPGDPFEFHDSHIVVDAATNTNHAEVSRTVTMRLTGATLTFVNGSPIPAGDIVVPPGNQASASLVPEAYYLDGNNDLIYSVKIVLDDFGLWQGNSATGLTGSYTLLGEGDLTNAGVCFVLDCPHEVDDVGIMDFMGHGNPGGVLSTHITETHAVLVNARTGVAVFSTFSTSQVNLGVEETTDGIAPYRSVKMDPMPVISPQCYQQDLWQPTAGGHALLSTEEYGLMGDVGVVKNERSLFNGALSFQPDLPMGNDPTPGTPTRAATIRVNVPQEGYDREWTDTFGVICGSFAAAQGAVLGRWSSDSVDVFDRYTVHVDVRPFTSKTGQMVSFVVVKRLAQKPVGYTADQSQIGVFILIGNSASALVPYTNVTEEEASKTVTFSSGNQRHVIWTRGDKWFISDYTAMTTKEVGSTISKADTLQMVNPDLFFSYDEKKRYFVNGWNRTTGALTLTQTDDGKFPPKDNKIATLGTLKELTTATKGATKKDNHAIIDTALVPEAYRT